MKKPLLITAFSLSLLAISPAGLSHAWAQQDAEHPIPAPTLMDRIKMMFSSISHTPSSQQDIAVELARQGQYDEALQTLSSLHEKNPSDQGVTRDYATVLSWAGRDEEAVSAFETLPSLSLQPDYVLAAAGHSYRKIGKSDKALIVYRAGVKKYPDSALFMEGEVRSMADGGDLEGALAKDNTYLGNHPGQGPLIAARQDIEQTITKRDDQKAVELARGKNYPDAITILADLHTKHPDDVSVTRDYLAVLDWQGGQDQHVVDLYKSLPSGDQPDYVLEAAGHAYRQLNQPENAFPIYQQGWQQNPDSVIFAEATIRCVVDQKKYDEALAMANEDLKKHGDRPEIVDIKKNILKLKPAPKKAAKATKKHR
ncbi:MAG TPA: tetratricopeptide repeat protein [Alphaproteobacteria bacterium]|nr:tetratricopeptide repeat protein [Alphaproteobacteria bacterium]